MIKTKKVLLGTLATTALVATPIATVVSCEHSEVVSLTYVGFEVEKNTGLSMSYKVLTDKQANSAGPNESENKSLEALMEKDSTTGKWKFKEFTDIIWKDIQNYGSITINVTLSDYVKENLITEMKNKGNSKHNKIFLSLESQNIVGDVKFFDTSEDNSNQENSKKIANKIDTLVKNNNFKLNFNLMLPKWLETDIYGEKIWLVVDRVSKIKYEDGMNKNFLTNLNLLHYNLTSFDPSGLPKGLKELNLSCNNLKSFDATKLPQGLKELYLNENNLTSFDTTHLPQGLKMLYLSNNKLTSFDTTHLPQGLKVLYLSDNKLNSFDATKLPQGLEKLNLQENNLKSFDTTHLPQGLQELSLSDNNLTSFDPSGLPQGFKNLWLEGNKLPQSEKDKLTKWLVRS